MRSILEQRAGRAGKRRIGTFPKIISGLITRRGSGFFHGFIGEDSGVKVRQFIPRLRFLLFLKDELTHIDSIFWARIGLQWLSEVRLLWPSFP